ncbi:MAG TPA: dipeptide ABC transporter ATP-binding protein [Steroidobacteraceae bacterium]|jgi:oligopeptide/dipeptide ABC transporter ATP-binding protein|nr:dipeptide ABC transporter ATP-binding protein [Steroidobacteraceae bacterium]
MPSIPASVETAGADPVLSLRGLSVTFDTPQGQLRAVQEVSLSVSSGECLGVVGESGAGKSQLFLAVMGLLAANGRAEGSARLGALELLGLSAPALDRVRGAKIGLVFQDPMTSLTPHLTVGEQLIEVLRRHGGLARAAARTRAQTLLERVHVSDAGRCLAQFPHELSGGMRQRVMIAIALAGEPQLLIADEPTTSLDVTIQAQILALLAELKRTRALGLVLITHDLAALAGVADRVAVLRHGRLIESGPVRAVLKAAHDPYTRALVEDAAPATQATGADEPRAAGRTVALTVRDLGVQYGIRRGWLGAPVRLDALTAVSLTLHAGEALGIVGESGSGKSTLARALLRLLEASSGRVVWMGRELGALPPRELRGLRRDLQLIFQDPLGSLDPRMTVAEIVAEPLRVHERSLDAGARDTAVTAMLARVGLSAALAERYPHELSGGQCQRVGIARAMILKPRLLVCDEPLSALDAPTQQQIVALLAGLRQTGGLSLLFISHNLALVRQLCERVLVLYLGRMMELAPTASLFAAPRHPYSRELLAAIPVADPDIQPARLARVRAGEPPSPLSPPSGCVYRTRCAHAAAVCAERVPQWEEPGGEPGIACHRWREIS